MLKNMNKVLKLLLDDESLSTEQIGKLLSLSEAEVQSEIQKLKADNILLGWRPVINPDSQENSVVRAAIELKINPEREGGFDTLAQRIARFPQVDSCYLMSGAYDLLLFVNAKSLKEIASFVYEKLATIHGVQSTATHFFLRVYKQQGFTLFKDSSGSDKPIVSP